MKVRILTALLVVQVVTSFGCAAGMRPASEIDETGEIRVEVAVGDTVRVLTKYGERPTFKLTEIDSEGLAGDGQRIPYSDMVFVERLATSPGESAVVALFIAAGAVYLEALRDLP